MKSIISWMAENHVTANLLMVLIILSGAVSLFSLKQEVFPEIPLDTVSVEVVYLGASPEDIENLIVLRVEESIASIEGISDISSVASEGRGLVTAEVAYGENTKDIRDKIKTEIDRIINFPENAERPVVKENIRKSPVIQLAIFGNMDEKTMTRYAEKVKDDLLKYPDISQVGISGKRNYEISIEISEEKLSTYGLTFGQLSAAVKKGSMDLPGGKIKSSAGEILLRTKARGLTRKDYENIVLSSDYNGHTVYIKDVANVIDEFEDSDLRTYFNAERAMLITVYRVGEEGVLDVSDSVKKYIKENKDSVPAGITMTSWGDRSKLFSQRMNLLSKNAILGLGLVLISLSLFLDIRLAFWTSMGIVISFFGNFIVMSIFDVSINMISLFAFILVLGVVVDDAIVVGESIFMQKERGMAPLKASKIGTHKITTPVIFAIFTTVAAFAPLLFVEGNMGKVMKVIPTIVISILLFSLFESLLILPAHLSSINLGSKKLFFRFFSAITKRVDIKLKQFISHIFEPVLSTALKNRYITLAVFIAIFLFSVGLVTGGTIKFTFFPEIEGDNMIAYLKMPSGTAIKETKRVLEFIEKGAERVRLEYEAQHPEFKDETFKHVFSSIGEQPGKKRGPHGSSGGMIDPSVAEVNIELISASRRTFSSADFTDKWRKQVGEIPGIDTLTFTSTLMASGNDVEMELSLNNTEKLRESVEDLKRILHKYEGVYNIQDNDEKGKYELQMKLKPYGATLGLTLTDLAKQVRQGFFGDEAMRIQRGKDEVKVMIRYPKSGRTSLDQIENMKIRTLKGSEIPFADVAEVYYGRGYSQINRLNRSRIISVSANVNNKITNANEVNSSIIKELNSTFKKKYPSLTYSLGGAQKQQKRSMQSILKGFLIAIVVIYILLAIPFKSYIEPFIIMSAIPFGVVGAILGHLIMGYQLSMLSAFGIVALAGVVVNDSLVLVDHINRLKRELKLSTLDIVIKSCKRRFRPILLTSLTTFLGLSPMILETDLQARFLIPMAISLGFGIVFATTITLIFVPSAVLIVNDIRNLLKDEESKDEVMEEVQNV